MKSRIVRIGNSRGIRIPKPLLEQVGLQEEIELEAEGNCLVIRPAARPRANWEAAFKAMAERKDDRLLDGENPLGTRWEKDEWEWR